LQAPIAHSALSKEEENAKEQRLRRSGVPEEPTAATPASDSRECIPPAYVIKALDGVSFCFLLCASRRLSLQMKSMDTEQELSVQRVCGSPDGSFHRRINRRFGTERGEGCNKDVQLAGAILISVVVVVQLISLLLLRLGTA